MREFLGNPTSIYRLTNRISSKISQSQTLIETFWEATNGPNKRSHKGRGTDYPIMHIPATVTYWNTLKPDSHITQIVKNANQRIGIIRRNFTNVTKSKPNIKQ